MKSLLVILTIVSATALGQCDIEIKYNRFDKWTTYDLYENRIAGPWTLNARIVKEDSGVTNMFLYVAYNGSKWFFVSEKPIRFMIDSTECRGVDEGSIQRREVQAEGMVLEVVAYEITDELMQKIAGANEATMRVYGSGTYKDVRLSEFNTACIRQLYKRFSAAAAK